jgi:hypothetical protein
VRPGGAIRRGREGKGRGALGLLIGAGAGKKRQGLMHIEEGEITHCEVTPPARNSAGGRR